MLPVTNHPLVRILSNLNPHSQFVTLKGYQNSYGDICDYSMLINISYRNAVQRSLDQISLLHPSEEDMKQGKFVWNDFLQAQEELKESLQRSLLGENKSTNQHAYHPIYGLGGQFLKGCRVHTDTRLVYIYGFAVHRKVIFEAERRPVNSAKKTLAKNWIRARLPVGKFVEFRLEEGKYEKISLAKISLASQEIPELALSEENSLLLQALQLREQE